MKQVTGNNTQGLELLAGLFRALSDETRIKILLLLADGPRNVTGICDELHLRQPTISHHLGLLRMRNLITCRRNGKQIFYSLNGQVSAAAGEDLLIGCGRFTLRVARKA